MWPAAGDPAGLPGLPGLKYLCLWALLNTFEGSLGISTLLGGQ